jgi:hypothetical protein
VFGRDNLLTARIGALTAPNGMNRRQRVPGSHPGARPGPGTGVRTVTEQIESAFAL